MGVSGKFNVVYTDVDKTNQPFLLASDFFSLLEAQPSRNTVRGVQVVV